MRRGVLPCTAMRTIQVHETLTQRESAYLLAIVCHCDYRPALRWLQGEAVRGELGHVLKAAAAGLALSQEKSEARAA